MATLFSPSAPPSSAVSTSKQVPSQSSSRPHLAVLSPPKHFPSLATSVAATAIAAAILAAAPPASLAETSAYKVYYGTAASAANYGGYGGNSDKKASAEYIYDVPEGWKERAVTKVLKGTNGTDSEFYNPRRKAEREYLTFLDGFQRLAPKDAVLDNLALSDVDLQDMIATADSVTSEEHRDDNGQVYYVYEIDGAGVHSLISVTCARNKLYAHFVNAPAPEWNRDQDTLRHLHESFKTVR